VTATRTWHGVNSPRPNNGLRLTKHQTVGIKTNAAAHPLCGHRRNDANRSRMKSGLFYARREPGLTLAKSGAANPAASRRLRLRATCFLIPA
jgi:hypothetical protein